MCVNQRKIVNKYTGRELYVKCGQCDSCLQEKADRRALRIASNNYSDYSRRFDVALITLTYENRFMPVVRRSDLERALLYPGDFFMIPVWRHASVSRVRVCRRKDGRWRYKDVVKDGLCQIGEISTFELSKYLTDDIRELGVPDIYLQKWKGRDFHYNDPLYVDYLPISWYPDVQNFIKRVKINLKRYCNYEDFFNSYQCSEYGETTMRPHFHAVAFVEKGYYKFLKRVCLASWKYDSNRRRKCERAIKPASYVASYVNCNTILPDLFKVKLFRPKCSFSPGLGTNNEKGEFMSIVDAFFKGDLTYYDMVHKDGILTSRHVVYPSYYIGRYFPRFRGFNRFTSDEIYQIVMRPESITDFLNYSPPSFRVSLHSPDDMCHLLRPDIFRASRVWYEDVDQVEDVYLWSSGYDGDFWYSPGFTPLVFDKRQINSLISYINHQYFKVASFVDRHTFAVMYSRVWSLWMANCLRLSYEDVVDHWTLLDHFDQIRCRNPHNFITELADSLNYSFENDINDRPRNVLRTARKALKFYEYSKSRKFKNSVYSRYVSL